MSWKAKKATPPAVDEEELQITLGLRKDPAVEFLEASNLKHVLESLVEAACVQLPDHFLDFAVMCECTTHACQPMHLAAR